ncbi:MAG: hypothetical protein AVDCRST_MAG77-2721 [uncultured Chloroflexi bacterium]|uniref:SGNH hydrolase-type esterase domain-containing protein n=1 Tax=uncultured Chloroflexota bacterium TaxID=166587 RepID=A0A6J4IZI3_9CHLR|nr:MAG: hypothetical protein AVDCRST_MAG77-2721 [uncultured Chloroflexota bacterium]
MLTLYTFGDSILDCGHYNQHGVHPGQLLVKNDDRLFPEFRGQDLSSLGPARLEHRARDGATVRGLPPQGQGLPAEQAAEQAPSPGAGGGATNGNGSGSGARSIAILTVGGNDLLQGLILDTGPGIAEFAAAVDGFLRRMPIRPVLIGNVYDPSMGDDRQNFLGVDPGIARANHRRINDALAELAGRYGRLVDLNAHFLTGDPSWFTRTIEPSLKGASEVRRAFWNVLRPFVAG